MNYNEFKRHIGKAGLTIRAFAELLKLNPSSVSNYSKCGEVPSHLAVIAVLLAELAERKVNLREVLERAEIATKKGRGAAKGKFGGDPQNLLFPVLPTEAPSGAAQ